MQRPSLNIFESSCRRPRSARSCNTITREGHEQEEQKGAEQEGKGTEQELCSQYLSISHTQSHTLKSTFQFHPVWNEISSRTKTFPNLNCMTHPQNCFAYVEYYCFFSPVLSASGNSSSDSHAPPQECQYHFKEMHQFRTPVRRARLNDPNPNSKMWRYVTNPPAAFGMELPVESFLDSWKTSRACHLWFGSSAQCITLTQNKLKMVETIWNELSIWWNSVHPWMLLEWLIDGLHPLGPGFAWTVHILIFCLGWCGETKAKETKEVSKELAGGKGSFKHL